ncbi:MAG TPA: helix-turn-helix domain-containing protein, partial [Verrucomicrobiae bacterium]|nr:helix-turn-helix domain-containing protein [Verrucomicrobiae bacterium]
MPRRVRNDLFRHGEVAQLEFGSVLNEADKPLGHVYFPLTAFMATIPGADDASQEIGLIGDEGMLGATLAIDVDAVPWRAVVQGSGTTLRIGAPAFTRVLRRSGTLRRLLRRYLGVVADQQLQGSSCNRTHHLEARLARRLLMMHDRAHTARFNLTQDFLTEMLNARRVDIGVATASLRRRRLITYARGSVRIVERAKLEAASCQCYELGLALYRRALGSPERRANVSGSARHDQQEHTRHQHA